MYVQMYTDVNWAKRLTVYCRPWTTVDNENSVAQAFFPHLRLFHSSVSAYSESSRGKPMNFDELFQNARSVVSPARCLKALWPVG